MNLVSAKFKAHLHNDLVSADSLTLLVVMSYLEAQSVNFPPPKKISLALLGNLLTAPPPQKDLGETLYMHVHIASDLYLRCVFGTSLRGTSYVHADGTLPTQDNTLHSATGAVPGPVETPVLALEAWRAGAATWLTKQA